MLIKFAYLVCAFTVVCFMGCNDEPKSQITNAGNPSNSGRGAAYLPPPYSYAQSSLAIPANAAALNDSYFGTTGTWSSSNLDLWGYQSMSISGQLAGFSAIGLPASEIIVAVIDTGVDYDAPDLTGKLWLNAGEHGNGKENNGVDDDNNGFVDDFMGWNWVHSNNHPVDDSGHGTHVSGTIAATAANSTGIVGVAPWVRIMALKVCDSRGRCNTSNIRSAINYAVNQGAKIINLSLGGPNDAADAAAFESAISDARSAGVLVIVAAGNQQADAMDSVPANSTYSMAIAANASDGEICSSFSNYGWKIDVSAPGCGFNDVYEIPGLLSLNSKKCGPSGNSTCCPRTPINGDYCTLMGTSMAAPHVSGLAALALTASPTSTPLMVRQAILRSTQLTSTMVSDEKDRYHGRGKANAATIIEEAQHAPGIKITSPLFDTSANTHNISFAIETRDYDATYELRYFSYATATNQLNLNSGTSIATGGPLAASSVHSFSQSWTPPTSGKYSVVLEVTAHGQKYYDMISLRAP